MVSVRQPFSMTTAIFLNTTLLSLLLLAEATPRSVSPLVNVQAQCRRLLTKISEAGHSHFELAALCRARVPMPVCQDALRSLGQSPWTHENIAATCRDVQSNWQARFVSTAKGRRLQSGVPPFNEAQQVQTMLNEAMLAKSVIGICTNMQLDECARFKAENYPRKAKEIERAITLKYHYWKGDLSEVQPLLANESMGVHQFTPEEKFEAVDVAVAQIKSPNLALTMYASFMTLVAASALVGLFLLRTRRLSNISRAPVLICKGARGDHIRAEESLMFDTFDGEENGNANASPE